MPISDSDAEDTPGHGWPGSVSQHRHRTGKSAGCCCFIFTRTLPPPITFSLYTQVVYTQFILPISFDRFEFFLAPYFSHALDYRSNQSISRRFFFFSLFDNSFLSSPFLSFYFLSFTRVLPLTPTLTRHLRNFTHYHWYGTITDAGGKKRISLVGGWSRLRRAACDGRRDTGHGFQIIRFSLCFRAMIVPSIAHRSKRASPPSRYDFSGRRYDSFMVITIPSTSR